MTEKTKQVVQVVKRFGLCGGMEEYVFRLSKELKAAGQNILVLCEEKVSCPVDNEIEVIELGFSCRKPRWLSHLLFSRKVKIWLQQNALPNRLVHSHERLNSHHLTTIHSTLFNFPSKGFPSVRKFMNDWLEEREITTISANAVVPVSHIIKDQLLSKYPKFTKRVHDPIVPGVDSELGINHSKTKRRVKTIGFLGQEWRRKGLVKVLSMWRELRKSGLEIKLLLGGFDVSDSIGISEAEKDDIKVLGWMSDKLRFYSNIDLLVHPAKREAFGMVIAEALSLEIPVLCSTQCGASIYQKNGALNALDESAPLSDWVKEVQYLLNHSEPSFPSIADWRQNAAQYINLYQNIFSQN
jgi:UDP-glucose:(heptosyl)LPS alpha-1,3-glucosyltransferase